MRLDNKKSINRLVIYFFYDADGIVDRYVPYMLNDIKKNCSELFVVVNGKLTVEGREIFTDQIGAKLLVRENKGFDVWAYKTVLQHYGWDKLGKYDEVVMMNHTIMGPIYPFSEMFEKMNGKDVDFWGITKHHAMPFDPFNTGIGQVYEHIQSHFIAVRRRMLVSPEFKNYWESRENITSYYDAIGKHEIIFTHTFDEAGFRWATYVDTSDMEDFTYYPLQKMPVKLLSEYRCPIFKRRSFFQEYESYLSDTVGDQPRKLMDYIKNHTDYDVDMIWENIIRTANMADIKKALNLDYILADDIMKAVPQKEKIALVIHQYFEDLIDYCYHYALSIPKEADIYITTDTEKKAQAINAVYKKGPWKNVKVIVIENRGRDVSSLLVGFAPYRKQYDLVCFVHDKKVKQLEPGIKGYYFSERCFENLLGTKELVSQILHLFEQEPRLGLLCPPPPNHSDFYPQLGCEWGPNYQITKELADKLKLSVPISEEKEPVAPLGTMFWFRSKALDLLYEHEWDYEDFPEEPNKNDGSILHAIERIYAFTVQQEGYYCAWVLSNSCARTELNNLNYMLREVNRRAFQVYGLNSHYGLISTMTYKLMNPDNTKTTKQEANFQIKNKLREKTPGFIWKTMRGTYRLFGGKKWTDKTLQGL